MDSIIAIIFGIVQGLTEFIPVSSSGHLLILHQIFPGFVVTDELAFDVALHVGTLLALFIYFWNDILRYLKAGFTSLPALISKKQLNQDQKLSWLIIVAIIPAGLAGFLFENFIEATFRSTGVVIAMLIIVAVLFILVERMSTKNTTSLEKLTWKSALFIGVAQVLALVPGTSRSGITMIAGMVAGLHREQSARFSFLISIPLVAGAGLKKLVDLVTVGLETSAIPVLLIGVISAAVVGYIAIAGLLKYLSNNSLIPFAVYRITVAAILFITFYLV